MFSPDFFLKILRHVFQNSFSNSFGKAFEIPSPIPLKIRQEFTSVILLRSPSEIILGIHQHCYQKKKKLRDITSKLFLSEVVSETLSSYSLKSPSEITYVNFYENFFNESIGILSERGTHLAFPKYFAGYLFENLLGNFYGNSLGNLIRNFFGFFQ